MKFPRTNRNAKKQPDKASTGNTNTGKSNTGDSGTARPTCFVTPMLVIILSAALFPLSINMGTQYLNARSADALQTSTADTRMHQLDKINYLPSLLPVIIENADIIELDQSQLDKLLAWRTQNREAVITDMNEIVSMRIALKQAALVPETSPAELLAMQDEIFRLQRNVMDYKLSCRELVFDTFTAENWDGFFMVLAEQGYSIALPEFEHGLQTAQVAEGTGNGRHRQRKAQAAR